MATKLPLRLHNGAQLLDHDPVTVETASEQWSYAAQFDLPSTETLSDRQVTVEIEVVHGEVGVGLLTVDETAFLVERQVTEADGLVSFALLLRGNQPCNSVVMRNLGGAGTATVFRVYHVTTHEIAVGDGLPQEMPIRLHNGARLLDYDPVTVETAPEQWSYAAQFDLPPAETLSDRQVTVEIEVVRGEVGVGLLTVDETTFHGEHQVTEADGLVSLALLLRADQPGDTLVMRNVGGAGTAAVFRVCDVTTHEVAVADRLAEETPSCTTTAMPLRLHNGARLLDRDPVTVETASEQWSYAAQFDLPSAETLSDRQVTVEIEVVRGEVGVGLLTVDETTFHGEHQVTEADGLVSLALLLRADQPGDTLVMRNVGGAGTAAVFRVCDVTTHEVAVADRLAEETPSCTTTAMPLRLHNGARLLDRDPVTVETASEQWSYAAQFDLPSAETLSDRQVTVEIEVVRGEVGVGLLTVDETTFHGEHQVTAEDGLVSLALPLRADQPGDSLVMRNVGGAGTAAVFRVCDVTTHEVAVADRLAEETPSCTTTAMPLRLHNGARLLDRDPVTVETASEQWSYAAQFDLPSAETLSDRQVTVEIEVTRGEVGVGLLTVDETTFHGEHQVTAEDGLVSLALPLRADQPGDSLVMRNVGGAGTAAVFRIHAITTHELSSEQRRAAIPVIEISSAIFRRFRPYSGEVPAGFWVNWLGVKTRSAVWPFRADIQAIYARTRHESCRHPLHDEHVLDWVPLLEAVLSSRETFRMIALGAGWGRWLSGGAFAAAQLGLRFHLTGVEAEPDHFAWMEQHMRDNNIDPSTLRLVHGAAAASDRPCWFPVASPDWYGQAIVAETRMSSATATADETVVDGVRLRKVRAVPIEQVIPDESIVDYLHLDIQGTEYEFLSKDPARLAACVRVINIGTHSEIVERRLRSLFGQLGWELRYDVSLGSKAHISLDGERAATIEFGDGVQVWSNPSLSAS